MSKWISVKETMAPKDKKFLFSYYYGMGIAQYRQAYTTINGNSERTHEAYFLVLNPCDPSEDDIVFEWSEDKMIEMEVYWMPLPNPPEVKYE